MFNYLILAKREIFCHVVLKNQKFELCLHQFKQLDSLNRVDPKVFNQTLTFIKNKKVLAIKNKSVLKLII